MKKFVILFILLYPLCLFAQETTAPDHVFQAKVVDVVKELVTGDASTGGETKQQQLRLIGLEDPYKGKELFYDGIGNVDVLSKNLYKINDKVLVLGSIDDSGVEYFYVTDYVRTNSLIYLFGIFAMILFVVGGWKGFRSLLSLAISFFIIMGYIVNQILQGADPIIVTIIGSFVILFAVIYLTEGFSREAHVGVVSIFISLIITAFLSWLFVDLAKLSGLASEETGFLVGVGARAINFKGLLMSGIIIGALGVLDDIVIAQVASVKQLFEVSAFQGRAEVFKKAYAIGISHISSMTNTLFLAYAGASLSLLILFSSGQSGFATWTQAVNNEALATEIVRTLAGSVGLIMAVPISTLIAVYVFGRK